MQPPTDPRRVPAGDAARHAGVPVGTMRRWLREGTVPRGPGGLVDLDDLDARAADGRLPLARRAPRRFADMLPPAAGLVLSWPEVDLLLPALHDAAQMRAAMWAAARAAGPGPEAELDTAARYALLAARLGIARDRAVLAGAAVPA